MPQRAEANLSALIESTEDLIWSVDLDYRLIVFNRALRQSILHDFGVEAAAGMRAEDLLPSDRAARWTPLFERALREGPFRIEYPLLADRVLELSFSPIAVDGKATGVSVFGKDITQRKAAERALRAAEEKYRSIFDGVLEGFYQTTLEGESLSANPALARMLGYDSPEDLLARVKNSGRDAWMDTEERARFAGQLEEKGSIQGYECRFKRKDGVPVWVSLNCRKVCGADGRAQYLEGFVVDIDARKRSEARRRESEELYRATFEQAAVGIVHTAFDGRVKRCNARFAEIIGYPLNEVPGMSFQQITLPDEMSASLDILQQLASGAINAVSWEKRYIRKDGSLIWVKVTTSVRRDSKGLARHYIAIIEEIDARKRAEERLAAATEALRKSEERYRTAFQTSLDAININRLSDGLYIDCNQAFLDMMGFERAEVIGNTSVKLGIWTDVRDRQAMSEMVRQNASCSGLEVQFKKKNGETVWGQMSASLIEIDGVACILSVTRDISHAKLAESEIRNLAFFDPLTGLPNRRLLMERLRQTLSAGAQSGRLQALLFVNLDNFKTLNETLSHPTGDLLLQEVARRIASCARETDTVGRLGGDEFVVMLEDLSEVAEEAAAQSRIVAEKILDAVEQPYQIEERECLSTASIGITVFGNRKNSTDEIMQQTDIALHQAKAAGRNTMRFFSPALQAAVNARAALEEDLRQAIKTRQFLLYYQPQVERGRLTGAEALIRWKHPRRGMVPPDEFIPLAEESGLVLPLGDWVLEIACTQIAAWARREETAHLTIAVNISALQFRQPQFVEIVLSAITRSGANPKNLKLELTESMLVDDIEEVIAKMTELKTHGLRFSLDDFGTGYSSLAYLKRLPLDQLKIDRAFVRDMLVDATSGAIAQTIISLGRAMELSVIAEGVETEEQRGFLAGIGCHAFQGTLLSPPLPLPEFEVIIRRFAGCAAVSFSL